MSWINSINSNDINSALYENNAVNSSRKPKSKVAYILLETNTGISTPGSISTCGSSCKNCYLVYGGLRSQYIPTPEESFSMKNNLANLGYETIFTGAELLTLHEHFDAGLFDYKPYLLSSGHLIAHNPEYSLAKISKAGINSIHLSLHHSPYTENIFDGIDNETVIKAINNINEFNLYFKTNIQVCLNVTVTKINLTSLSDISDYVFNHLKCKSIRFNRHKSYNQQFKNIMLTHHDNLDFYQSVQRIRQKYPLSKNYHVSVAADFGSIGRNKPFKCFAGLKEKGPITILPQKSGSHLVFPCLELRHPCMQIGTFMCNSNGYNLSINSDNLRLFYQKPNYDGCLAYELSKHPENNSKKLSDDLFPKNSHS